MGFPRDFIGSFKFPSCNLLRPTTTTFASSGNPSLVGLPITFTATVTGAAPTGTLKLEDGAVTIAGCAAVTLAGSGNTRTAACSTSSLTVGSRRARQRDDCHQSVRPVIGAGRHARRQHISNLQPIAVIQLGSITPPAPSSAEIDFQGLNLAAGSTLTIRSGAPGQFVFLANTDANGSAIAGTLQAQGGNGAPPPSLYVKNRNGFTLYAGGAINSPSGLGVDTTLNSFNVAQPIVNAGTLDGGTSLELVASRINGGGSFRGNAIAVRTSGSANNPVSPQFLSNGLQLFPSSGSNIALVLNAYGSAPQFLNLQGHGDMSVWMPSAWPVGSPVPANNAVVAPNGVRAAGVPDPAYGGGSMILQATGSIALVNGGTNDFVFPGGMVFKAGTAIDTAGVLVNQGWTTSGQSFQGTFFEAPTIVSSNGFIQSYTNNLNWVNFSTFPATPVRALPARPQRQRHGEFRRLRFRDATPQHVFDIDCRHRARPVLDVPRQHATGEHVRPIETARHATACRRRPRGAVFLAVALLDLALNGRRSAQHEQQRRQHCEVHGVVAAIFS